MLEEIINVHLIETYLKLKNIKGFSDKLALNILEKHNTLSDINKIPEEELAEYGIKKEIAFKIRNMNKIDVIDEIELIKKHQIKIFLLEDEDYPYMLKNIYDPPMLLYAYGEYESLKKPSFAVVGSRKSSEKGKKIARDISSNLAELGFNIVSGFALGIDINAHLGAMEKGSTSAVFGNGLLTVYPASNKRYLNQLLKNGVILSELPLNELPNRYNFPRRNRIISGLSVGVLVVEAAPKSGSLITAKLAVEHNRELFSVPTSPSDFNSATNKLIKSGAFLVENYLDVLENLSSFKFETKQIDKIKDTNIIGNVSKGAEEIYELLKTQPLNANEIVVKLDKDFTLTMEFITELEMEGFVKREPGGMFTIL